jgi:hypothetical protein
MPTVLFAFDLARVTRQHSVFSKRRAQSIGAGQQSPRDSVANGIGLGRAAATFYTDYSVELVCSFGHFKGLKDSHSRRIPREVVLEGSLINRDLARAWDEPHTGYSGFAAAGTSNRVFLVCHRVVVVASIDMLRRLSGGQLRA